MAARFVGLEDLPLFATDEELAVAVVGPERAKHRASVTAKGLEHQPGLLKMDASPCRGKALHLL
jgi:hypothetical protein